MASHESYTWLGANAPYLDTPATGNCGAVTLGFYGGSTSAGARKNEDGALVWRSERDDWTFAMVLDAHASSESARLVMQLMQAEEANLTRLLALPMAEAFTKIQQRILACFQSEDFRLKCREVQGETACLICVQKEGFLWWFSIGDCVVYLLHPELARLGQYALNQRQFFEWVGQVNTFEQPVAAWSSGVRELRSGPNHILLLTDGVLEFGDRPFEEPARLYEAFASSGDPGSEAQQEIVRSILERVHLARGRDSATIIHWTCRNNNRVAAPTLAGKQES
jgi:serine/threonine protein phosphatase PrpC